MNQEILEQATDALLTEWGYDPSDSRKCSEDERLRVAEGAAAIVAGVVIEACAERVRANCDSVDSCCEALLCHVEMEILALLSAPEAVKGGGEEVQNVEFNAKS